MIKATQKVKFAQSTWLHVLGNFTEYLYLKFSQCTWVLVCAFFTKYLPTFQQKYLYLYLVKQNVLVVKYIVDVLDPSLLVSDKI